MEDRSLNIAIVDDMDTDRERIKIALQEYAMLNCLEMDIESFTCGEELLDSFRPLQYTLIFLDIYMTGMTGVETAARIREKDDNVYIVFLTTSEDHRAEAFSSFASGYIIKSSGDSDIYRTLDHILRLKTERGGDRLSFMSGYKEYNVRYDDIVSLCSDGNYITITCKDGTLYRSRMKHADARKSLSGDSRFLTVTRGVIVNLEYVKRVSSKSCCVSGGAVFPISSSKSREISRIWHNYMFDRIRREELLDHSLRDAPNGSITSV